MNKTLSTLYVAQFDDDPYCAPYAEYIFIDKEKALNFAKEQESLTNNNFRCITEFTYNGGRYEKSKDLYYIDKSSWDTPEMWEGVTDKTFIDGTTFWKTIKEKGGKHAV
jgi:hypothetical protein